MNNLQRNKHVCLPSKPDSYEHSVDINLFYLPRHHYFRCIIAKALNKFLHAKRSFFYSERSEIHAHYEHFWIIFIEKRFLKNVIIIRSLFHLIPWIWRFHQMVSFFCVKPKDGEEDVKPEYFFSLWLSFCQNFKDYWKREQQRIVKLR